MLRAPLPDLSAGERVVTGALFHYLGRVLRLRAGDAFTAFDPAAGITADATVTHVERSAMRITIGPPRAAQKEAGRELVWVQGLAKGEKCDAVVRDATELGATRIVIARTARSVVKLDEPRARSKVERWERIAREAARQSGRAEAPGIEVAGSLDEALATVDEAAAGRFFLYEKATDPLGPRLVAALAEPGVLAFVAGPEGGFDDAEAQAAEARGWAIASLGPLTLRTETVAAAVLGATRVLGEL